MIIHHTSNSEIPQTHKNETKKQPLPSSTSVKKNENVINKLRPKRQSLRYVGQSLMRQYQSLWHTNQSLWHTDLSLRNSVGIEIHEEIYEI